MATMIFNEDGTYKWVEDEEVIPTKAEIEEAFVKKITNNGVDDYFFFDKYIKGFNEELVRKYNDQINFEEFYNNREGKHVKPYFSPSFVRELIAANQFTNDLIGEIVSYESGLRQYVNWERQVEPNKKLIDEYKDEVIEYWEAIYGPQFKKMNGTKFTSGNELERMQQMKQRLLECVK